MVASGSTALLRPLALLFNHFPEPWCVRPRTRFRPRAHLRAPTRAHLLPPVGRAETTPRSPPVPSWAAARGLLWVCSSATWKELNGWRRRTKTTGKVRCNDNLTRPAHTNEIVTFSIAHLRLESRDVRSPGPRLIDASERRVSCLGRWHLNQHHRNTARAGDCCLGASPAAPYAPPPTPLWPGKCALHRRRN